MSDNPKVFQCPECGLHYRNQAIAQACEKFCRSKACNPEIAKLSIEREAKP